MFDNIGGKIKTLAVVVCVIGMIGSVIGGIVLWTQNSRYAPTILPGIIIMVAGCLGSWVGGFFTFGFGQLIESTEENNAYLRSISKTLSAQKGKTEDTAPQPVKPVVPAPQTTRARAADWKCHKCGTSNPVGIIFCRDCGEYK